jgi:hypothetical protein
MRFPWFYVSRVVAVAWLLLAVVGCGPRLHPVRGKVTYADGKPVTEGMVVFESKGEENPVTARGEIQPDGSYELGTYKPGDGARAGTYRVLVAPKSDPNAVDRPSKRLPFDARYMNFKTSGLECEVTGGTTEYPIQVGAAGNSPR